MSEPWNETLYRRAVADVARGVRVGVVMKRYGFNRQEVTAACRRSNVAIPTTDDRRILMASAVEDGWTPKAIAEQYGISEQSVRLACLEFGIPYRPKHRRSRR